MPDELRNVNKRRFKKKMQEILVFIHTEEDDYVEFPIIIEKIQKL